jgi:hypothetical protein
MAWSISRKAATVRNGSFLSSLSFLNVSPRLSTLNYFVLTNFVKNSNLLPEIKIKKPEVFNILLIRDKRSKTCGRDIACEAGDTRREQQNGLNCKK